MPPGKLAIILPPREGFSPSSFGAISLCVRDFALHSRYSDDTTVYGLVEAEPFDNIRYSCIDPQRRWYENLTRAYARALAESWADSPPALIELQNRPSLLLALRKHTQAPLALHLHNDPQEMSGARSPAQRTRLLHMCSAIYCVSEHIRDRFCEGLTHNTHKVHVVHNGIEPPAETVKKQPVILYVGRMTPNKGVHLLTEALTKTLPEHPQWKAVFIGGRRHSPTLSPCRYERSLRATLAPLGAQAEWRGFQEHEQTMQAFAQSSIVVVPSLWDEPFGRTALEGMAHGCAVISSGHGGLREVTGDAAFTLPHTNVEQLADALQTLIKDETQRNMLGEAARRRAQQFSLTACTKTLDDARAAVIASSGVSE